MPCGGVLREALKYDAVAALILYDEPNPEGTARNLAEVDTANASSGQGTFWKFFDWIVKSSFEVCTDAFNTFRVCTRPDLSPNREVLMGTCRKSLSSTRK